MADVLFVVPPLTGHTNPTVAVGGELSARGHRVAWCGYPQALTPLLPAGARVVPVADELPPELLTAVEHESQGLRGAAALKFLFERFLVPLADAMVDGVDAAVEALAPDVLVVDQQALAGAIVARRRDLTWATSATTSAELVDPFTLMPKLGTWRDGLLVELQQAHGLAAADGDAAAIRASDQLVIAFTTAELVGADQVFPASHAFVGPAFGHRPPTGDFPFAWLEPDRGCALVSLGTVNDRAGERFFGQALEAFAEQPDQAVLVAPPELFAGRAIPGNVLVRARVPQLELLAHVDVVVSHGGHNTVCETLAHGRPLVVAPIRDDQPIVADQVVRAGAAIRVKYGRVGASELRAAVDEVRTQPSYRDAARHLQASFAAAGGAATAADALEKLVADRGVTTAREHEPTRPGGWR